MSFVLPNPDVPLPDAALSYARQGWRVFPCKTDKTPYTSRGFKNATNDVAQVEAWWSKFPDANIGLPTGRTVAIDLDTKNGDDGLVTMLDLGLDLPQTLGQWTPSGGSHFLYQHPVRGEDLKSVVRYLYINGSQVKTRGVDVRAWGGYIVAPPSITTEGQYVWFSDSRPTDLLLQRPDNEMGPIGLPWWPTEIAPAPDWLYLDPPPKVISGSPGRGDKHNAAYVNALVRDSLDELEEAPNGERNDTLNRVAFRIGQTVGAGLVLNYEPILDRMVEIVVAPDFPQREAKSTIRSGFNSGRDNPL